MTASPLAAREAYSRWAPTYDEENVVSALDERAVSILTPPLTGRSVLDAGCGTARRLRFGNPPRFAAGFDLTFEMLAQSREDARRSRSLAVADMRSIPVADASFDVVWCRLAIGHLREIGAAYREFARVLRRGGYLVVTDFHPEAARAGHSRTFRDVDGASRVVEHFIHEDADHEQAAAASDLTFDARIELGVGSPVRHFYERAGAIARYNHDLGLPLLLAMRFVR